MNRNRVFYTLTALALTLSLTACGGDEAAQTPAPVDSQTPAVQSGSPVEPTVAPDTLHDSFVFPASNGTEEFAVSIDQDMAEVLAALGEAQSYFEAASCAFEGLDKTYTYPGFQIITRPEGDKDYVNSILLTDDSVTTQEGIYIGGSKDDITAAYGAGEETGSAIMYTKGNVTLSFILEGDKIISIEYLPA